MFVFGECRLSHRWCLACRLLSVSGLIIIAPVGFMMIKEAVSALIIGVSVAMLGLGTGFAPM